MLLHRSSCCSFVCLSFRACRLCGWKTSAEGRAAQLRFHSELVNVQRRDAPTLLIKLCLSSTSPETTHAARSLESQGNQLLSWSVRYCCAPSSGLLTKHRKAGLIFVCSCGTFIFFLLIMIVKPFKPFSGHDTRILTV